MYLHQIESTVLLTGFEIADFNQFGSAYGNRTRAPALRGPCPNP